MFQKKINSNQFGEGDYAVCKVRRLEWDPDFERWPDESGLFRLSKANISTDVRMSQGEERQNLARIGVGGRFGDKLDPPGREW